MSLCLCGGKKKLKKMNEMANVDRRSSGGAKGKVWKMDGGVYVWGREQECDLAFGIKKKKKREKKHAWLFIAIFHVDRFDVEGQRV